MATIYRAYANGEEITDFPINGVNTKEIWGGDTLLWKKSDGKPPMKEICSVRTTWTQVTDTGTQYPCECELSVRNQTEDGSVYFTNIEKAGIYTKQEYTSSGIWGTYSEKVCMMFKATVNPKSTYLISQKNVKQTLRMWNTNGELLDETENWLYSSNYNHMDNIFGVGPVINGVFNTTARPTNYGYGPSTGNFRATIYTSGSGYFESAEDVVKYMLE